MDLRHLLATATLALAATAALAQPLHYTKAIQLVDEITAAQDAGVFNDELGRPLNRYGGNWTSAEQSYIRFADLAHGHWPGNLTKCSPLVSRLLQTCYGWNWKNYSFLDPLTLTTQAVASPTPYQYIALLKQGKGFAARLTRLDQWQAGDLLFWWKPGSDLNDHAMIISAVNWASAKNYPTNLAASDPTLANTAYYEVEIIDSTENIHTADSRLVNVNGTPTFVAGVGAATIGVLVDRTTLEIVATTWSLPTSNYQTQPNGWLQGLTSRLKRVPQWEIAVGRMP